MQKINLLDAAFTTVFVFVAHNLKNNTYFIELARIHL